jgi:hypothetical protein
LRDRYVLVRDFGNRFATLSGLPKRYDHGYPRYLYASHTPGDMPGAGGP